MFFHSYPISRHMATTSSSIAFLAVARIADKAILAERLEKGTSQAEKKAIETSLSSLLDRAAYMNYPGWKEQRQCSGAFDGSVFALADAKGLSVAAVGIRGGLYPYPPRVAWELLKKLTEAMQQQELNIHEAKAFALALPLKKPMQEVMKGYSDAADKDTISQVQQKVDGVKSMMNDNVRKIIETHTTLDALQEKSATMNDSAVKFVQQSTTLKRQMQIRNLKIKVAVILSVAALGTYVMLPFFN
jgi:hypothetical protein